jgi:hypothetical protein
VVANPLRDLATDAAAVGDVVRAVEGPVLIVAHSYGGAAPRTPGLKGASK